MANKTCQGKDDQHVAASQYKFTIFFASGTKQCVVDNQINQCMQLIIKSS